MSDQVYVARGRHLAWAGLSGVASLASAFVAVAFLIPDPEGPPFAVGLWLFAFFASLAFLTGRAAQLFARALTITATGQDVQVRRGWKTKSIRWSEIDHFEDGASPSVRMGVLGMWSLSTWISPSPPRRSYRNVPGSVRDRTPGPDRLGWAARGLA